MPAAIVQLPADFAGVFDIATIERFLSTSHDQFAADSAITRFLRAERFARQRLQALARVEGHQVDDQPVVLFLCIDNAGRSPMALGFVQHLTGPGVASTWEIRERRHWCRDLVRRVRTWR